MAAAEQIRIALRTSWHCGYGEITPVSARFCLVSFGVERYVAIAAPATHRVRIEAALTAAERLSAGGVAAGAPFRTADGALTAPVGDHVVALLDHVSGRPLDPADPLDQVWWGSTLAAAHQRLCGFDHPGLVKFPRVRPEAAHLSVEPWLRPAVAAAVDALNKLSVTDQLTYGILHGAPGPAEFRIDADTGRAGLVDWTSIGTGPLVYDLACALVASGTMSGQAMLDSYVEAGLVTTDEVDSALPTMVRYRWAVLADESARRIAAGGGDSDRARLATAGQALARCAGTA